VYVECIFFRIYTFKMSTTQSIEVITDKMEKTIERMGGTQCGADWCISALDPFHDSALNDLRGLPDGNCMKSVVEIVTSAATVSCPSTITTGTWECQLNMWNWHTGQSLLPGFVSGPTINSSAAAQQGLTVFADPTTGVNAIQAGGLTWSTGASGFTNGFGKAQGIITPANAYIFGNYRVIGQAFEVRSIGPALYRSGASYLWRLPTPDADDSPVGNYQVSGTGVTQQPAKIYQIDQMPLNINDAELIPDTVMLKAEEGCYIVSRFNNLCTSVSNDPLVVPVMRGSATVNIDGRNNPVYSAWIPLSSTNQLTVGTSVWVNQPTINHVQVSSFDQCGAMFTGLSLQDVLELRVRWIIEKFPTIDEPTIMILATPSPQYDPVAIEAYSKIIYKLPVGVPVRENGLGDWFRQAASTLGSVAGPILSALPHPAAKAAGTAITAVAKAFKPPDSKQDAGKKLVAKLKNSQSSSKPKAKKKK